MATSQQINHFPEWWYRNKRPQNDNAYFENLCRIIFQTGLNWKIVAKKWPNIKRAFCEFDIYKVAHFTDDDVKQLLTNEGVIRNPYKIPAIIHNAKRFQQIIARCGSFQAYIDSFDKSDNYRKIVKDLADTLDRIGQTTAEVFLLSVGENIHPKRIY